MYKEVSYYGLVIREKIMQPSATRNFVYFILLRHYMLFPLPLYLHLSLSLSLIYIPDIYPEQKHVQAFPFCVVVFCG